MKYSEFGMFSLTVHSKLFPKRSHPDAYTTLIQYSWKYLPGLHHLAVLVLTNADTDDETQYLTEHTL